MPRGHDDRAELGRTRHLRDRVWSERNVTVFAIRFRRHPLVVARLDMPRHDLPGDLYTRDARGANGASERMIVSPGREAEGIMHMPTARVATRCRRSTRTPTTMVRANRPVLARTHGAYAGREALKSTPTPTPTPSPSREG